MINRALRLAATAVNLALLAFIAVEVAGDRSMRGTDLLALLLAVLAVVINLLAMWLPEMDREERQLEAGLRKAELRRRIRELEGKSAADRREPLGGDVSDCGRTTVEPRPLYGAGHFPIIPSSNERSPPLECHRTSKPGQ